MSGISYNTLVSQIRNYTEVDSNVLTTDILENIILNAQQRIFYDVPIDADRHVQEGTLSAGNNSINAPAGALFIRGIEVFNSTSATTGPGQWLEKKDQTYLAEYVNRTTGPEGGAPPTIIPADALVPSPPACVLELFIVPPEAHVPAKNSAA